MFCSAISRMGCGTSNGLLDIFSPPRAKSWVASVTVSLDIEKSATRSSYNKRHDCVACRGEDRLSLGCADQAEQGVAPAQEGKLPSVKHIHRKRVSSGNWID